MKAIAESLYERSAHSTKYVRRRIPAAIRSAYPPKQTHVVRSLGTTDRSEAKSRSHIEIVKINAEFELKRRQLDLSRASKAVKRISKLTEQQLQAISRFWMHQVLLTDEQDRQQGLEEDDFDELGEKLTAQRAELGRMLAQGKTLNIFPALHGFSTGHFRHRCIANEVAISAIVEGYRASTEREISQGLWVGGKQGIAGKLPDALLRSGASVWWVEVERSRKNAKDYARLLCSLEAFKQDALRQSDSVLLGDKLSWAKVVFICTPAFRAKLCRDLAAAGWSEKDIEKLLKFEMSLYSFKDIMFS